MFYAMDSFKEWERTYQRAVRVKPFPTLEKAKGFAVMKASGVPFVQQGGKVVWVGKVGHAV